MRKVIRVGGAMFVASLLLWPAAVTAQEATASIAGVVKDASGAWQTAIADMGFPVGRPQTVVVDLRGRFRGPSREVRIVTNMRIAWDQILVASPSRTAVRERRLEPVTAEPIAIKPAVGLQPTGLYGVFRVKRFFPPRQSRP